MRRTIALAGGLLLSASALAGEATVSWTNADGIAGSELAVGSCLGDGYGLDVADEDGLVEYARLAPDVDEALILRLEQGETFCFRARHFAPSGARGEWLFLGSKRIPRDSQAQPPLLPMPGTPTAGSVK